MRRWLWFTAVLAMLLPAAGRHTVEDDATFAPSMVAEGPLEPCVQRIEYHKTIMMKTLLSVSFAAFFLGVCACTVCGGFCWCLSARISMSENGRLEQTFDSAGIGGRLRDWKALLSGERSSGPRDDCDFGLGMVRRGASASYGRIRRSAAGDDDRPPPVAIPPGRDAELV